MGARPRRRPDRWQWRCSFCGNDEKESLLASTTAAAFICDECVEAAAKLIAERKATPA